MENEIAVKLENVSKFFGKTSAVNNVSFEARKGEIFGLLGPNGAGKTTTIRVMLQLIDKYQGKVTFFDKPFSEKTKNLLCYLPEERGLYKNMTALQIIKYLAALKGVPDAEAEHKTLQLLQEMELMEYKDKKIFALSKGTQQKIQIISSIIHNPELVVFDEPFSGLDPISIKFIIGIILREKEKGKTIILSTHNMNIAEEICDRVIVINRGRRVLYGKTEEIKQRYAQNSVIIETPKAETKIEKKLQKISGVKEVNIKNPVTFELLLEIEAKPEEILKQIIKTGIEIKKFDTTTPSLKAVFMSVIEAEQWVKV